MCIRDSLNTPSARRKPDRTEKRGCQISTNIEFLLSVYLNIFRCYNSITTFYQPSINLLSTVYQPYFNLPSTFYQPFVNLIPTVYQPSINLLSTFYQLSIITLWINNFYKTLSYQHSQHNIFHLNCGRLNLFSQNSQYFIFATGSAMKSFTWRVKSVSTKLISREGPNKSCVCWRLIEETFQEPRSDYICSTSLSDIW